MFRATEGTLLASLIALAIPVCQEAERRCPRTGPGRKPMIPDWVMAVLIMVATLKRRKSKSAQYRFVNHHRTELSAALGGVGLPKRSTYFDRFRRAATLYAMAVRLQGEQAIREGLANPPRVALDKSVVAARGPKWHARRLPDKGYPRGADREATWTHTPHDGWVQGYAYEVVVTAGKGVVWPLLASAHGAGEREPRTALPKLAQLPAATRYVMADAAYDTNACTWAVEGPSPHRGRRFVCPVYHRGRLARAPVPTPRRGQRRRWVDRRGERRDFVRSPRGRKLLRLRSTSVEPFNAWLKALFEFDQRVWHRGWPTTRPNCWPPSPAISFSSGTTTFVADLPDKCNGSSMHSNSRTVSIVPPWHHKPSGCCSQGGPQNEVVASPLAARWWDVARAVTATEGWATVCAQGPRRCPSPAS